MKPIETRYKNYRFRSRLEARWAVFFDAFELKWEYEAEGFDLGEAGYYLPDFWFPESRWFVEVKAAGRPIPPKELAKIRALDNLTTIGNYEHYGVAIASGTPTMPVSMARWAEDEDMSAKSTMAVTLRVLGRELSRSELTYAVQSARSARFEHGECG